MAGDCRPMRGVATRGGKRDCAAPLLGGGLCGRCPAHIGRQLRRGESRVAVSRIGTVIGKGLFTPALVANS